MHESFPSSYSYHVLLLKMLLNEHQIFIWWKCVVLWIIRVRVLVMITGSLTYQSPSVSNQMLLQLLNQQLLGYYDCHHIWRASEMNLTKSYGTILKLVIIRLFICITGNYISNLFTMTKDDIGCLVALGRLPQHILYV